MRIGAGCWLAVTLVVALVGAAPAGAVIIRNLEVTHNEGSYLVTFDVLLVADPAKARALIGDYRQWPRLSKTLKESRLLRTFPDRRQRVKLRFRSCVLFICKTIRQVKDVTKQPNGDIVTFMVSDDSDFESGWERWHMVAEQEKTRIHYRAELVPSFRVPPLIGPWILKSKLRRSLTRTAENLERLATP